MTSLRKRICKLEARRCGTTAATLRIFSKLSTEDGCPPFGAQYHNQNYAGALLRWTDVLC
jgi:hypothetical protein